MIIIEVEMPMMGKEYDFRIDEDTPLYDVKEEITEMICQKEQCPLEGEMNRLMMWNIQTRTQLMEEKTASENRLHTGSRILLV